jgi:hypothetical protein
MAPNADRQLKVNPTSILDKAIRVLRGTQSPWIRLIPHDFRFLSLAGESSNV